MENNFEILKKTNEIIEINKEQKNFYNSPVEDKIKSPIMEIWSKLRKPMYSLMWHSGIWGDLFDKQLKWMGDLKDKKVLDFGCYSGNDLSIPMAEKCKYYIGIDLSNIAVEILEKKIKSKNLNNAKVMSIDILSQNFKEKDFDVIYAQGVIHHFKHLDVILTTLADKLRSGGLVITFDPMQTAITSKILRALYHPFRSDKDWEFPFTKNTFRNINEYFNVVKVQGVMGYSKWCIPVAYINKDIALKFTKYLHQKDMKKATMVGSGLWKCLHVSMCWIKK